MNFQSTTVIFFIKIAVLITLVISTISGLIFVSDNVNQNYFAAIADKHRYAQSIQKPKIILIGGSNLALGIASDSIEKAILSILFLGMYDEPAQFIYFQF